MNDTSLKTEIIIIDPVVDLSQELVIPAIIVEPEIGLARNKLTPVKRFGVVDMWSIRKRLERF
ncbi:MAG TPA: hypothetical protein VHD35_03180 [Chitinophagaceae bacterium]|nr:hypothetical protein [Chitinophagaceae bacterium]